MGNLIRGESFFNTKAIQFLILETNVLSIKIYIVLLDQKENNKDDDLLYIEILELLDR